MTLAYEEYDPVAFPCLAEGCDGRVWVTNQKALRWYHNHSGGQRPRGRGLDRCVACEAKIRTVTVPCRNEDTGVPGDRRCIGDGNIRLYDQNQKAAVWYVMNGCRERPVMYPYCDRCRDGILFTGPCRNRGCRGDGTVRCPGHEKKTLVERAKETGDASWWPPRNCQPCREFIANLDDVALTCLCCRRPWRWSRGRQIWLLQNEPRSAFVRPELCDACLALGDDERKSLRRRAFGEEKQRAVRRVLREAVQSIDGRQALRATSRVRFLEAARTLFRAPDRHTIDERVKAAALTRIARLGGDEATEEFRKAVGAVGSDAGRIGAMLANGAITDDQTRKVSRALAKLASGGEFPKAFSERLKVPGGLRMTTGLAGTASTVPRIAQAAAYEIHATAAIVGNRAFPYPFSKSEIATFHYRFQHNLYRSASGIRSFEGDIVIQHGTLLTQGPTTSVDFKHSMTGKPFVTSDELERLFDGLTHGVIDRAVIVSNAPLTSLSLVAEVNERIRAHNRQSDDDIPPIRTFVQAW